MLGREVKRFGIPIVTLSLVVLMINMGVAFAQSSPDIPQNLGATTTHDSVTLTWDDPDDDTITGYKILRKVTAPQTSLSVYVDNTGNADTRYIDENVVAGETYTYRVMAINEAGQSARSNFVRVTTLSAITDSFNDVNSWGFFNKKFQSYDMRYTASNNYRFTVDSEIGKPPPSGKISGDGYAYYNWIQQTIDLSPFDDNNLFLSVDYRAMSDHHTITTTNAKLHILDSNNNTLYTGTLVNGLTRDTEGQTFSYDVTDVVAGHDSVIVKLELYDVWIHNYHQVVYFDNFYLGILFPPQNLRASTAHDSVTLSWDDPQDDRITGYKILRSVSGSDDEPTVIAADTQSADTTFVDASVISGVAYEYNVIAINEGSQSPESDTISVTVPGLPSVPQNLQISATHDSVTLSWDDPDDDSITGYKIMRRVPTNNNPLTVLVADTGSLDTSYTDRDVISRETYAYRVIAINEGGESERSAFVKIRLPQAPPIPTPQNLQVSATHDSVTLSWDDPQDDRITGYKIMRRVSVSESTMVVIEEDTGNTRTSYTDNNVVAEKTYAYRVIALGASGESERSNFVRVTTPYVLTDSFDNGDSWELYSYQYSTHDTYVASNNYAFTIDSRNGNPSPSAKISGDGYLYRNYIQQTIDLRPFNEDNLFLSVDYRVMSDYTSIRTTNAVLRILDSDGNTLYRSSMIDQLALDTGWQTSSHDIAAAVAGHDSVTVRLGFYDAWIHNYHQVVYFDNFYLGPSTGSN